MRKAEIAQIRPGVAQAAEPPAQPVFPAPEPAKLRLASLDAFRGFIMVMLASHAFGLSALMTHPTWSWLGTQFEHVEWEGMVFWDLIQPAFMFMVGMAMPFSSARRRLEGQKFSRIFGHVLWRSLALILLSQILISVSGDRLSFQLINVLSQIAFTYFFCFLVMQLPFAWQAVTAALILAGHWALFVLFPGSEGPLSKTDNIGAVIDLAVLGKNYSGSYVTINFAGSIVTTLFGVWAGQLVMKRRSHSFTMGAIGGAAAAAFALGWMLEPFNPMVKRLWTASFAFASAGWVLLMLLFFYWIVEVRGYRRPAFPLVVVGMNSIFIYSVSMVLYGWTNKAVGVFTGGFPFAGAFAPVVQAAAVFLVLWYLCYWLYKRKIFFRI